MEANNKQNNSNSVNSVLSKLKAIPETRYILEYRVNKFPAQSIAINYLSCIPHIWVLNNLITKIQTQWLDSHNTSIFERNIEVLSFAYSDTLFQVNYGSRYIDFKFLKVTKCDNTNYFDIEE